MPTIERRGKPRYKAVVQVNGKRKEKRFPDDSRESKRAALKWEMEMRELLQKEQEHQTPTASSPSILTWATDYLNDVQTRFIKKTYKEKCSSLRMLIKELGQNTPVDAISVGQAQTFLTKQFSKRSGYAVNKDRKNLAAAWTWGSRFMNGFPDSKNPFQSVPKFPEDRNDRYVPPIEDFYKVLAQTSGQDRVILQTFFYTAARRGEIWNLTWEDVDFTNSRIRLWTRKRLGGSREFDWIPMVDDLASVLAQWKQDQPYRFDHVFVNLSPQSVGYMKPFVDRIRFMRRMCEAAGVEYFGYHAIRHLTASELYRAGHSIALIQKVLRHKNPNTTARYIRSLGLEEAREALQTTLKLPT
ncbi:MAG: tyrosine-type recombinase/integrase [Candidatus Dojkabacteria bacterium]